MHTHPHSQFLERAQVWQMTNKRYGCTLLLITFLYIWNQSLFNKTTTNNFYLINANTNCYPILMEDRSHDNQIRLPWGQACSPCLSSWQLTIQSTSMTLIKDNIFQHQSAYNCFQLHSCFFFGVIPTSSTSFHEEVHIHTSSSKSNYDILKN